MKEFKVNDYLTLRLEDNKTNIYVKEERFDQCKLLLIEIPIYKIQSFDGIKSIDEAAENLDWSLDETNLSNTYEIPPETEFWGHCSNIQVWFENNYNTKLLHRHLAFPLLKKLTEVGDSLARRVFREEIAKRFESGYKNTIDFLREGGYTEYLSREEKESILIKKKNSKNDAITELATHREYILISDCFSFSRIVFQIKNHPNLQKIETIT